jgi:hypothetical protein
MFQIPLHVDTRASGDTMTVFSPPHDITAVERVFRWFLSVPRWVMLGGVLLAVVVGVVALVVVFRQRHALLAWVRRQHLTTPVVWKAVIGGAALVVLMGLVTGGGAFFVYSQNNNQFCLSCHTLHDEVFARFQQSKHHRIANLRCHDCHNEPLLAEVRQIGLWMVERPESVGPHAPVPRAVCANCHIRTDPDSSWQRIVATAGHSVHVLSDTAQKLRIECLTCHGVTAHRFVPVAQTCEQSGCHEHTKFRLGKMAGQTGLHCTVCHEFTAPIQETPVVARARAGLVPTMRQCLGCHAMQLQLATFDPARDAHKGRCGDCHDPHRQTTTREAFQTCTTAGCHARPETLTPFHRGLHAAALSRCGRCHETHTWTVRGEACLACHRNILKEPRTRT